MRYSILSRFTGALIGSYIGETLIASGCRSRIQHNLLNWTKIGIDNSKIILFEAESAQSNYNRDRNNSPYWRNNIASTEAAIISLSQLLLYHESFDLLREEVGKMSQYSGKTREDVLIWGYALSLACREKEPVSQSIHQIIAQIQNKATSSNKLLLLQLQEYVKQNIGLQPLVEKLSRQSKSTLSAIALALYCFASTPEDFQLCLKRAISAGYQPRRTGALTGAIAGAYNSISAIPLSWRRNQNKGSNLDLIYQFSRKLFEDWSGTYQSDQNRLNIKSVALAAANNNIQSRPFFQTISQK